MTNAHEPTSRRRPSSTLEVSRPRHVYTKRVDYHLVLLHATKGAQLQACSSTSAPGGDCSLSLHTMTSHRNDTPSQQLPASAAGVRHWRPSAPPCWAPGDSSPAAPSPAAALPGPPCCCAPHPPHPQPPPLLLPLLPQPPAPAARCRCCRCCWQPPPALHHHQLLPPCCWPQPL